MATTEAIDPWPQTTASADNDFEPVLVFDDPKQAGGTHLFGFVHWRLRRHGETILWGVGRLDIELPFDEGYRLEIGPRVNSFDEVEWNLETESGRIVGWAEGRIHHKMKREVSPDIRAYLDGE